MAVTIKEYIALYSAGNEVDLTAVNQKAAEGWELCHFFAGKGPNATQVKFVYIMERSAGQAETDVLVGTFTVGTSADQILLSNHGLVNGQMVRFALVPGGTLPAPLVEGVYYFVVNARGNDFQVSLIADGAPVDITTQGVGANQVWKK